MDQLDLFSINVEEVTANEDEEVVLIKFKPSETRYRSLVKIGEGTFYKEVLKSNFPKGHSLFIGDYYGEVCKECLKTGFISELDLDKRWKRCDTHGWIEKAGVRVESRR